MAIKLNETFTVDADIDTLWAFILKPENIANCMPGASIDEIIDERQFSGRVKVSIGAISARYRGTITYAVTDRNRGLIEMRAQAIDKSGGTVDGSITTELRALSRAETELTCYSEIDLTGRLVAVSRGMIEGVAGEIIDQFINNVRRQVETDSNVTKEPQKAPNVLWLVLKVAYTRIANKLRHILGKKPIAEATK